MAIHSSSKGKKRAYEDSRQSTASSSSVPPQNLPAKKARRAETRQCPVCDEAIPLRLLPMHAQLEAERVEDVIKQIGSSDILYEDIDDGPGPSSRSRRSAIKALKSINLRNLSNSSEQAGKILQTIKRHRKQRHTKLREIAREEEEGYLERQSWTRRTTGEVTCPVCSVAVTGDQDVLDAHVDSCLANENRRLEEERQQRVLEDQLWEDIDSEGNGGYVGNVRGTGFHTRGHQDQDIEEDIDVDGDDQSVFGEAQFTEGDILPVNMSRLGVQEELEIEINSEESETRREQKSLRDLVAEGKVVRRSSVEDHVQDLKAKLEEVIGVGNADRVERAVVIARKHRNESALIAALDNKVKHLENMIVSSSMSLLCRICLDPYNEPTVSTGCWHTCCRECWLRCLGSTKLCPICKRITGATDLRRIYL